MGFFSRGRSSQEFENEVMQKLASVPIVDRIVDSVLESIEKEPWLNTARGYYDSRRRVVSVEEDSFEIKWSRFRDEAYIGGDGKRYTKEVEDVYGNIGFSFTKSGYLPLHGMRSNNGFDEVSDKGACALLATIIRERLMAKMPECDFGEVDYRTATFAYLVPKLTFKDWY